MKTSFHVFGIILLALLTISMSDCPDRNGDTESSASGSYRLFFLDGLIGSEDGITGSLTLESNGSWSSIIRLTSPDGIIKLSGTRRDAQYLYVARESVDGLSFSGDNRRIRYTFTEDMVRYIESGQDYIWVNVNVDWAISSTPPRGMPLPPSPEKSL